MTTPYKQADLSRQATEREITRISAQKDQVAVKASDELHRVMYKLGFDAQFKEVSHRLQSTGHDGFFSGTMTVQAHYNDLATGPKVATVTVDIDQNLLKIEPTELKAKLDEVKTLYNFAGDHDIKKFPVDASKFVVIRVAKEGEATKYALYHPSLDIVGEVDFDLIQEQVNTGDAAKIEAAEDEIRRIVRARLADEGFVPIMTGDMNITVQAAKEFKRPDIQANLDDAPFPTWLKASLKEELAPVAVESPLGVQLRASREETAKERMQSKLDLDAIELGGRVEGMIMPLLKKAGFTAPNFYKPAEAFLRTAPVGYDGTIVCYAKVLDANTDELRLPIVVEMSMSQAALPSTETLKEKFAAVVGKNAKEVERIAKEELIKLDELNQKGEMEQKVLAEILASFKAEPVKVQASETATMTEGPNVGVVLEIQKNMFPDNLKVGDIVEMNGLKYKITGESDQLNSQPGTAPNWVLQLAVTDKPAVATKESSQKQADGHPVDQYLAGNPNRERARETLMDFYTSHKAEPYTDEEDASTYFNANPNRARDKDAVMDFYRGLKGSVAPKAAAPTAPAKGDEMVARFVKEKGPEILKQLKEIQTKEVAEGGAWNEDALHDAAFEVGSPMWVEMYGPVFEYEGLEDVFELFANAMHEIVHPAQKDMGLEFETLDPKKMQTAAVKARAKKVVASFRRNANWVDVPYKYLADSFKSWLKTEFEIGEEAWDKAKPAERAQAFDRFEEQDQPAYASMCASLKVLSFVRPLPGGKWGVFSHKGKLLGKHDTKEEADKQLAAIEIAKHAEGSKKTKACEVGQTVTFMAEGPDGKETKMTGKVTELVSEGTDQTKGAVYEIDVDGVPYTADEGHIVSEEPVQATAGDVSDEQELVEHMEALKKLDELKKLIEQHTMEDVDGPDKAKVQEEIQQLEAKVEAGKKKGLNPEAGKYHRTKTEERDGYKIVMSQDPTGHYAVAIFDKDGHIVSSSTTVYGAPEGTIDEEMAKYLERWPDRLKDIKREEESAENYVRDQATHEDYMRNWKKEREKAAPAAPAEK